MRIEERRLKNLTQLIQAEFNGNKAAFAAHLGKNPSYVSRWYSASEKHKRNISGETARDIEKSCDYPDGWLDGTHGAVSEEQSTYSTHGTHLADTVNGAPLRHENRIKARRVPVFKDQDILERKSANELIQQESTQTVTTDIDVTDNAYGWMIPTNELGDLNLPFSTPVMATLIIEPGIKPKSGDWVIIADQSQKVMVKRYETDLPHTYLHSLKSKHEPFRLDESVIIYGVVASINLKTL